MDLLSQMMNREVHKLAYNMTNGLHGYFSYPLRIFFIEVLCENV